jgi:hypothetical protein
MAVITPTLDRNQLAFNLWQAEQAELNYQQHYKGS